VKIGKLVVHYWLDDSGEPLTRVDQTGDMPDQPIIVKLGLLDLAKDTLLHPDDE
jgi:hypothetical protein